MRSPVPVFLAAGALVSFLASFFAADAAIGLVLGGAADRKQVRTDAEQASITAEFAVSSAHGAWDMLDLHGLACG